MTPIPITAAKAIATEFGYDQVVIIARAVGADGGEQVTTFGKDVKNCAVAAQIGDFLKHKVMGWPENHDVHEDQRYRGFTEALRDILNEIDKGAPDGLTIAEIEKIACRLLLEAEGVLPARPRS